MSDKALDKINTRDTPSYSTDQNQPAKSNNAASNGYWIHDDVGPKHYVAPAAFKNGQPQLANDLLSRLDMALRAHSGFSRLHVAMDEEKRPLGDCR